MKYLHSAFAILNTLSSSVFAFLTPVHASEEDSLLESSSSISRYIISGTALLLGLIAEANVLLAMEDEQDPGVKAILPITAGLVPATLMGFAAGVGEVSARLREDDDSLLHFYDDLAISMSVILFNLSVWKNSLLDDREACGDGKCSLALALLFMVGPWNYAWIGSSDYFGESSVPVLLTTATVGAIPLVADSIISFFYTRQPRQNQVEIQEVVEDQPFVALEG